MADLKVYLDASIVLRRLLRQPGAVKDWAAWDLAVSSELLELESLRTLDRLRVMGALSADLLADRVTELSTVLASLELVPVTRAILRRAAAPLSAPLGALDAVHLATAQIWMESHDQELLLQTHDRQLGIAARACGVAVQLLT